MSKRNDAHPKNESEKRVHKALDFVKPRRQLVIFFVMALLGINLEVLDRAVLVRDLVGHCVGPISPTCQRLSVCSLAGWSSLWMLPIYGIIGVLLGLGNEASLKGCLKFDISKLHMIWQCLIALAVILFIEFTSGCVLNLYFGLAIWNYEGAWGGHLYGQICTVNAVIFFFLCPLGFWLDDVIRFVGYNEERPDGVLS